MSLTALALAIALQAPGAVSATPVVDLIGLSPTEVAARTGAAPDPGPADALRIAYGDRIVELYPARRFWRRPVAGNEACLSGFEDAPAEGDTPQRRRALVGRTGGLMAFENGRLIAVYPDLPPPPAPSANPAPTMRELQARMRAPRAPSPLAVAAGRLPLSDGEAVLGRLEPAAPGAALVALCRQIPERTYRSDPGMDILWGLVGLAVLPAVPFRNAEEARAEREGTSLLASIDIGADLGTSAEAWVGRRRGVRLYRDPVDPDFAVIAVKLGSGSDTAPKVGLLGVRGTRVIWKVERAAADQTGVRALMCRDAANRATDARPGCSGTGFLIP